VALELHFNDVVKEVGSRLIFTGVRNLPLFSPKAHQTIINLADSVRIIEGLQDEAKIVVSHTMLSCHVT
jgi:hypothetical protein